MQISLSGTYDSRNLGDRVMQRGASIGLRRAIPDCEIVLLTPNIEVDKQNYTSEFDRLIPSRRKNPLSMVASLFFASVSKVTGLRPPPISGDLREIEKSDVILFTNGDMFTEDSGVLVGLTHIFPMLIALTLKKRYFLLGQSIGKFKFLKGLARYIIMNAEAVFVREQISMDYVLSIAPGAETRIFLGGDFAFISHFDESVTVQKSVRPSGPSQQRVVGLSLSNLFLHQMSRDLGIAKPDAYNLLREALRTIKVRLQVDYLLIPHVRARGVRDDFPLLDKLRSDLGGELKVVKSSEEAASQFKNCVVTLSSRMHANVASLAAGTPLSHSLIATKVWG